MPGVRTETARANALCPLLFARWPEGLAVLLWCPASRELSEGNVASSLRLLFFEIVTRIPLAMERNGNYGLVP